MRNFDKATVEGGALRVQRRDEGPEKPAPRVSTGLCACGREIARTGRRGPLPMRCEPCRAVAKIRAQLVSASVAAGIAQRPDIGLEIRRAIDYIDDAETR